MVAARTRVSAVMAVVATNPEAGAGAVVAQEAAVVVA
jgi:hypothetical protein